MTNFQQIFNNSLVISGIEEIDDNLAASLNGGNTCSQAETLEESPTTEPVEMPEEPQSGSSEPLPPGIFLTEGLPLIV